MITSSATLIISVYDNTRFLNRVLESVRNQSFQDFDIIISEDGENENMKAFVSGFNFNRPFQHLTQPDEGWRKNRALNRAILASDSEYLIFIDGDCVLHPRFIEEHMRNSGDGRVLGGKRLKMNEELSESIMSASDAESEVKKYLIRNISKIKQKGIRFPEESLYINPKGMLGFIPKIRHMHQLKGCNMSFPKKAILSINGFDEDYSAPAIGEDIDLTWRFMKAGYSICSVRNLAVQYHLYHKESWNNQDENIKILNRKKEEGKYFCLNGIVK